MCQISCGKSLVVAAPLPPTEYCAPCLARAGVPRSQCVLPVQSEAGVGSSPIPASDCTLDRCRDSGGCEWALTRKSYDSLSYAYEFVLGQRKDRIDAEGLFEGLSIILTQPLDSGDGSIC